ncbi:alkaline phosphatase family protein [Thalassomonas viridans]|uniref:Alkaline phosphatase family protein n=1 Tax=Thalassomonas viridans TaxID=137584 RepID=A0AAF0C7T3_9GAMM|nr:PAN domain-containing protein [Thalassomonas viridans]WDE05652.1 alkaline phosphatase family protein [Thalassomonas viridans]
MKKSYLILAGIISVYTSMANANTLNKFDLVTNAAIYGHNVETLSNVSPQQCATQCLADTRNDWCVSFDYYKHQNKCDLSDKRAADVGGLKTDYQGNPYDHYSLKPEALPRFVLTENAAIYGHNNESLENVTAEDCAAACTSHERSYWCRSFDYHKKDNKCDLSDKRAGDVGGLKTDYSGNPYDHYSLEVNDTPNPIPGKKHVLLIGIDGLRGDSIQCAGCARTDALDALISSGAFHSNVIAGGDQVTSSGPGWASVFTGFWSNKHGVTSNNTSLPMLKPHVFELIKQTYPTATTAVVADWYNLTHNLLPNGADHVVANSNKASQQATDTVKGWLSWDNPPTAIFYYLHNVDIHTSSYDPLSSTYKQNIASEDAQIQQVLTALTNRPNYRNEEWLIVVTSDHGGINRGHGGQSNQERNTFLILNNNYLNPGKASYCSGDLSATPLYQVDSATPHILDFLGINNTTDGNIHPDCGY